MPVMVHVCCYGYCATPIRTGSKILMPLFHSTVVLKMKLQSLSYNTVFLYFSMLSNGRLYNITSTSASCRCYWRVFTPEGSPLSKGLHTRRVFTLEVSSLLKGLHS